MFFWLLLFGFVTGSFAERIGVPQLFLVPEYGGGTGILAFGIVGFALGGFITAFNLYTYIMNGYRFPFIATLSRPFHKFAINNFLIPGIFLLIYCWNSAQFQLRNELIPPMHVAFNLGSLLFGVVLFQGLSYFYFRYTNKDARAFGQQGEGTPHYDSPINTPLHASGKWMKKQKHVQRWRVETYIYSFNRIALARESGHYDREILERVFTQNHINAARFEVVLIASFLLIGSLRENEYFVIPAAASSLLFFTMLLMLISALHSWVRGWTLTLFVVLLVMLNFFYSGLQLFRLESRGYGMNYSVEPARYEPDVIDPHPDSVRKDIEYGAKMLHNWKRKFNDFGRPHSEKPKLVILTCSGGGSRSAFWTMRAIAVADSLCGGELMRHTTLMTGASGGMVGSAFMRELFLRKETGEDIDLNSQEYSEWMSRDLLNPVILSTAVNDWFIRYQTIRDGNYVYKKDRGWAFEKQLVRNTNGLFDKRMSDYTEPEFRGIVPMMILSPTIINDGRRLLIASQPISYLVKHDAPEEDPFPLLEEVEFSRLFAAHDASNLRFISALRMNATFPYVFPITTLPSKPEIGVMDAGIRDNFGLKTSYRYLQTWRNWINTNTSGVIIVQIRDLPKGKDLEEQTESIFGRFMAPMGSIYGNMTRTQDYTNQQVFNYMRSTFEVPLDLVNLQLFQDMESHVSLSWHLTRSEREFIMKSVNDPFFLHEVDRLRSLLGIR